MSESCQGRRVRAGAVAVGSTVKVTGDVMQIIQQRGRPGCAPCYLSTWDLGPAVMTCTPSRPVGWRGCHLLAITQAQDAMPVEGPAPRPPLIGRALPVGRVP